MFDVRQYTALLIIMALDKGYSDSPICVRAVSKVSTASTSRQDISVIQFICLGYTGWPQKRKPLPNNQKIVLNRIKACQ